MNADNTNTPQEDFAALLDAYGGADTLRLQMGDKVEGKIIHITDNSVFVQLSQAQEASLPREEVIDKDGNITVAVGDTIEAFVVSMRGGIELSRHVAGDHVDLEMLERARESGMPVEGTISGVNKGGLEVHIGNARGFCPMGQFDIDYVEDATAYVGQTFEFLVREVKEKGRNVLLSRRALLEQARKALAEELLAGLEEGAQVEGKVTRLAKFGAFVDLGGIDGLIPISELAFSRIANVEDVLAVGDSVSVKVLRIEDDPKHPGKKRIGLSLKATKQAPFDTHAGDLEIGNVLQGTVVRVQPFGAFVELFDGVQGLVHISELADRRVAHPNEIVSVGDSVQVRVLGVDREQERVSLSLREAQQNESGENSAGGMPKVGDQLTGTVSRIERYGVFVTLPGGDKALIPAGETGADRDADLKRLFPIDKEVRVVIIEIDERERLKASIKAVAAAEERAAINSYNAQSTASGGFNNAFAGLLKKRDK